MIGLEFFALGILTVIYIIMIVGLFGAWKYLYKLNKKVEAIELDFRIHMKDVDDLVENDNRELRSEIAQLYSYMDSRFDKFENRIINNQSQKSK